MIVQAVTGMTLLGAAPVKRDLIDAALKLAPFLVAADGGVKHALANGHMPQAVIGDFDSATTAELARVSVDRLYKIDDQHSTDFEKCLAALHAPFIVALGVTGARLDHTLAAMMALTTFPDKKVIVVGETDICFLCPATFAMNVPLNTRLSLFPMARVSGTSQGLKYPIDGVDFSPDGKIGTSNEMNAEVLQLTFEARKMLVLMPKRHLGAVVTALTS